MLDKKSLGDTKARSIGAKSARMKESDSTIVAEKPRKEREDS